MTTTKTKTSPFKVGDAVRSAPDSSDITFMKGVWHAEIIKVWPADNTPDGWCYETAGVWEWPAGKPAWLSGGTDDTTPTLRQLWTEHLVADDTDRRINLPKT